jgi:hypothetical protein
MTIFIVQLYLYDCAQHIGVLHPTVKFIMSCICHVRAFQYFEMKNA